MRGEVRGSLATLETPPDFSSCLSDPGWTFSHSVAVKKRCAGGLALQWTPSFRVAFCASCAFLSFLFFFFCPRTSDET